MQSILLITESGDGTPSGQIRAIDYIPYLNKHGYLSRHISIKSPILTKILNPKTKFGYIVYKSGLDIIVKLSITLISVLKLIYIKRIIKDYEIIFFQRIESYNLIKYAKHYTSSKLIYDITDGLWLPSRSFFANGNINNIISMVDIITCDNIYGINHFDNKVGIVIPDPSQVEEFEINRKLTSDDREITIGWIGSEGTMFNLFLIFEAMESLFSKYDNISFRILGTGFNYILPPFEKVQFSTLPTYNREEMIKEVSKMDIGLFPMFNIEDSFARGILKAEIYMSGGACLCASPIGEMNNIITNGVNGYLCSDNNQWIDSISSLIENKYLRDSMSVNGINTMKNNFSREKCFSQFQKALNM